MTSVLSETYIAPDEVFAARFADVLMVMATPENNGPCAEAWMKLEPRGRYWYVTRNVWERRAAQVNAHAAL